MRSDGGCITCQKHCNLPRDKGLFIYTGLRETIGDFFSLTAPKYSFFYLPHNVEMKEAKNVCPLESIVTTAITQVIWLKLRHPARFSCALASRRPKTARRLPGQQNAPEALPPRGLHCGLFHGQFQSIVNTTRDRNLQCHLLIRNVLTVLVRGAAHSRSWWPWVKWAAFAADLRGSYIKRLPLQGWRAAHFSVPRLPLSSPLSRRPQAV